MFLIFHVLPSAKNASTPHIHSWFSPKHTPIIVLQCHPPDETLFSAWITCSSFHALSLLSESNRAELLNYQTAGHSGSVPLFTIFVTPLPSRFCILWAQYMLAKMNDYNWPTHTSTGEHCSLVCWLTARPFLEGSPIFPRDKLDLVCNLLTNVQFSDFLGEGSHLR